MQTLLIVCYMFAATHEVSFYVKKTFIMTVMAKWLKSIGDPQLFLGGQKVSITMDHKYLGMFITDNMCDNNDIKRQMKGVYARGNVLLKRFNSCSHDVKTKLFKAYCSSFYCVSLWCNYTVMCYKKLNSAYNRIFRIF